ncbi:MAG: O-antigen ligase family protein [Bryobacteraceae bacterium]
MSRPERMLAQGWEIGAFVLAIAVCLLSRGAVRIGIVSGVLVAAAAWGAVQWGAGWTVSPEGTAAAVTQWAALGALALAAENLLGEAENRARFLRAAAMTGGLTAIVCLAQPFATGIGYDTMAGPFQNRNTYCSFVELLLPVAVWRAGKEPAAEWAWWMAAAAMVASAIATGSRAGGALVAVEFGLLLVLSKQRRQIVLGGALAALMVAAAGWETLRWRAKQDDPMRYRSQMIASAAAMAKQRPATGFGLGSFQDAYPRFATFDVGKVVNHAHNDWVEWAAEGIGFAILLAVPWIAWARRVRLWSCGAAFVLLHSLVDYPMQRAGMAAWVWLLAAVATVPVPGALRRRVSPRAGRSSRERVRSPDRSLATAGR